jgi:hypothetical protein
MTTVVDVHGKDRITLCSDPSFLYVGRFNRWKGWEASVWENPFSLRNGQLIVLPRVRRSAWWAERDRVEPGDTLCTLFRRYLLASADLMARLPELRGKKLGCWCGDWAPGQPDIGCHAVVLAQLVNAQQRVAS